MFVLAQWVLADVLQLHCNVWSSLDTCLYTKPTTFCLWLSKPVLLVFQRAWACLSHANVWLDHATPCVRKHSQLADCETGARYMFCGLDVLFHFKQ